MTRPLKIDLADGPCEHCAAWRDAKDTTDATGRRARACDDCGQPIPVYLGMGGAGYQAATVHHFHLGELGGRQVWEAINRELCRPCYLIDFAKQSPGAALPELK